MSGGGVLEGAEEEVNEVLGLDLLAVKLLHIFGQHVDKLILTYEGRQMPEKKVPETGTAEVQRQNVQRRRNPFQAIILERLTL